MIEYNFPTTILFGENSIKELPKRIENLALKNCLIVTDSGLIKIGIAEKITSIFENANLDFTIFSNVHPNPIKGDVIQGVQFYKDNNCDGIIALGGGSPMDVAKTIRFMSVHEFPLEQYDDEKGGDRLIINPMPPLFAIPTTAGTGSEVGRCSVITLDSTGKKTIFFHPGLMPNIAVLDPNLTLDLPKHISAATGMDAFTHCFEAFMVSEFHPMADAIAIKGMELIVENLPLVIENGLNINARGQMLLSATMGATAFQKGLGMTHSMAHPLSAEFGLHHGLANALCLPPCVRLIELKIEHNPELKNKLKMVSKLFSKKLGNENLSQSIQNFIENIGIKMGLKNYHIDDTHIEKLSQLALEDSCHKTHPFKVKKEDFINCFKESL